MKKNHVVTTIQLPTKLHKQLKIEAINRGITMSDIIVEAFERRAALIQRESEAV